MPLRYAPPPPARTLPASERIALARRLGWVRHDANAIQERLARVRVVERLRGLADWEREVVAEWHASAARLSEEQRRLEERLDASE